jgi:hypothetical protein
VLKFTILLTAVDGVDRKEIRDQGSSTIYHQLLLMFAAGSSKTAFRYIFLYFYHRIKVTAVVCKSIDLVLAWALKLKKVCSTHQTVLKCTNLLVALPSLSLNELDSNRTKLSFSNKGPLQWRCILFFID